MSSSALALLVPLLLQADVPSEIPDIQVDPARGLRVSEAGAAEGFVLFSPIRSRKTFVIDARGEILHQWDSPHPPLSVYLLDDGTLLRVGRIEDNPTFHGGGLGGRIQQLAKDGSVIWEFVLSDAQRTLHHDIEPLPNGNVLAIGWELVTKDEAVALGRDPAATHEKGWWPDFVVEIRPTRPSGGEIVWEWRAQDHLVQDFDPSKPGHGSVPDRPERIDVNGDHRDQPPMTEEERREREEQEAAMRALGYVGGDEDDDDAGSGADEDGPRSGDWLHTNSVDYDPIHDLVLLSTPEFNEIWIIDHSTTTAQARGSSGGRYGKGGDLLYRWGNPRMYGMGTDDDRVLFYQHQPEWVPAGYPGAGRVTIFNNGQDRPGVEHSSIEEIVLPFDPARGFARDAGKPFGPVAASWSYSAPRPEDFYSFFISGCHRLPNGNTFVCSGKQGRFFEVTPAGKIVWEYWNPYGGELEMSMGRAGDPPPGAPQGAPPAGGPHAGAPAVGDRPAPVAAGAPGPDGAAQDGAPPPGSPVEPTSCFRATKLAPSHPGLKALGIVDR